MSMCCRRDLLVLVLSLSAGACSEETTGGTTAATLCDGSDQARLGFIAGGGFVDSAFSFYGAYGHSYFLVDGMCRFWAGGDPLVGLRTGALTAEQADRIARETHFAEIPALSAHPDTESCPDAGDNRLGTPGKTINCTCHCDTNLPKAIGEAFTNAREIHTDLMTWGAAYDGPLRAAARLLGTIPKSTPPPAKTLDWTLPWSPATIAFGDQITADSGKPIDTAEDRLALRQLRAAAAALMTSPNIYVRMPDDQNFAVFARDEPPAGVSQAITGLWSR